MQNGQGAAPGNIILAPRCAKSRD